VGVLSNLNWWEIMVLALIAMFIFGPERLPKVLGDVMRVVRGLRNMARNATADLSRELGTEVKLEDLHPKAFIRKHVLSDDDEALLRRPFEEVAGDLRKLGSDLEDQTRRPVQKPADTRYDADAT
jgi:sec-independent protein translocase protein TatB